MYSCRRFAISGLFGVLWLFLAMTGYAGAASPPAVSLEQAIQVVRQNFVIPAEYSDFSSSLNQYDGGQAWYLVWNTPDRSGGNFSAQVDAVSGEVTGMNTWQAPKGSTSRIPVISWTDARQTSSQLLQRLIPGRMASLVMIEDQEPSPISSSGPITYTVNWRRVANQLPVDGIAAWVNINAANGEVQGYSLNWSPLTLPGAQGVISPAAAQQSFIRNEIVKLEYKNPEQIIPYTGKTPNKPMLVYIVDHPSEGAIDAFTGEPLVNAWEGRVTGSGGKEIGGMGDEAGPTAPIPLSPEEQAEVENIAGLLSQQQAADIVMKWAGGTPNLALRSASLDKDWRDREMRIWSLNWFSPGIEGKSARYLYGRVNARTGELLSFNMGLPVPDTANASLSQDQARSMADDLLRRIQGTRFGEFRLDPSAAGAMDTRLPVTEMPVWNFRYIRLANDIPFPANGAEVVFDRLQNRITSYNLNWDYSDLPKAEGIVGLEEANRIYLQSAPLTLTYAPYYSREKNDTEMRLVYLPKVPDGRPGFRMMDAFSGGLLDHQGQPAAEAASAHVFNDIAGSYAENEITLLGKAGLMTEYGDAFHPAEPVQLVDLLQAMVGIYQGPETVRSITDSEVMQRALAQGWLKEALPPQSAVQRGLMAQIMIRSLGLEYLAEIGEIYQLPYRDAASITKDLKGYAALSWGLGIIRSDGVRFAPQHTITREEAAAALVHSLAVKR